MQLLLFFFVFMIMTSCDLHQEQPPTTISSNETSIGTKSALKLVQYDTILINSMSLILAKKDDLPQALVTLSGDTILNADHYHSISFPDINEDGFKDIRVYIISNTPNQSENYLFDNNTSHFIRIGDSDLDTKKLSGTNLFFSYNRAGCADSNWESHLSGINNWQEVKIGRMEAKSCGDKDDGIYIYKIQNGKEILVEKLQIDSTLKQPDEKWTFIERFWEANWRTFPG